MSNSMSLSKRWSRQIYVFSADHTDKWEHFMDVLEGLMGWDGMTGGILHEGKANRRVRSQGNPQSVGQPTMPLLNIS